MVRSESLRILTVFTLGASLAISSCMFRSHREPHGKGALAPSIGEPAPSSDVRQQKKEAPRVIRRVVRATAYNAMESQTDSTPTICAWGDTVRPGIIAVSRDLEKLGLTRGKKVHVEGFGNLIVLDRMHRRKKNQIDIFMTTYEEAVRFGVKELKITWAHDRENDPRTG